MARAPRKAISASVRFEVFKRDKFTCQYCGCKAPDVILHADHIKPVAEGGGNDILNLVTSCVSCNLGKGARLIDDTSVVERQRAQLEELEARREQLEMMLRWRDQLADFQEDVVQSVVTHIDLKSQFVLNEHGRDSVRKWVAKYPIEELLNAIDTSFSGYLKRDSEDQTKFTNDSWNQAFNKVPGVLAVTRKSAEKPHLKDLFYVRGILRNRLAYVDERYVMTLMEIAIDEGMDVEALKQIAKTTRNWTNFRRDLHEFIDDARGET